MAATIRLRRSISHGHWMPFKEPNPDVVVVTTWISPTSRPMTWCRKNGNAFSFDNARQTLLSRPTLVMICQPGRALYFHVGHVVGEGQNDFGVLRRQHRKQQSTFNIGTHTVVPMDRSTFTSSKRLAAFGQPIGTATFDGTGTTLCGFRRLMVPVSCMSTVSLIL